jgi:hypothetical protein
MFRKKVDKMLEIVDLYGEERDKTKKERERERKKNAWR